MSGDYDWLVESDVANFFPYVDVSSVIQHVLSTSNLGEDVCLLLDHMLRVFAPMRGYRSSRLGGLPQEPFDCSRVLAHTYLGLVDEQFREEGSQGQFSRWVDDIVIGAKSRDEALQFVRRAQEALEHLGLYPNSAKTRILRSSEFGDDYMKAANDYLGELATEITAGAADIRKFRKSLRAHLRLPRAKRPKAWSRVLRRYYTSSRQLRDATLLAEWTGHLLESPESARHIFDYLGTYPLTVARVQQLIDVLNDFGGVYEDIDLLAHEYLCTAPNPASTRLRSLIAEWALKLIDASIEKRPRLAASACMTVGKFGLPAHLDALEVIYARAVKRDTVARLQATIVLYGAGRATSAMIRGLVARSSHETAQSIEYLLAVTAGEKEAVNLAVGLIQPSAREHPTRAVVRPRAVFLAPLVRAADPKKWATASVIWRKQLEANPREFRDRAAERWLFG